MSSRPYHARRGATAPYVAVTLPVIGMFAAIGLETLYLSLVQTQLQGVADAASQAAMLQLDGTAAGLDAARADAVAVVNGSWVNGRSFTLDPADVIFGAYDPATGVFTPTDVPQDVNSVKVPLVEDPVGLGLGLAFFGKEWSVSACSAVMAGDGNANTGDIGGPGLANGHFDYDSTAAITICPGSNECKETTKHTHQYDDKFDVTSADLFSDFDGHLPVNGCVDGTKTGKKAKAIPCTDPKAVRALPDGVPFKITVANADLSPGAWLTINGVDIDVTDYDDIAFADLPTYTLGGGANELTQLVVNFDVNAIANCELIPTNTGDVKKNTKGILGEWRSGALTIQLVSPAAVFTPGLSSGDHDVVRTEDDGLYYEATYFWHWNGPSYIVAEADAWQAQYDTLDCGTPVFIDKMEGSSVCGG